MHRLFLRSLGEGFLQVFPTSRPGFLRAMAIATDASSESVNLNRVPLRTANFAGTTRKRLTTGAVVSGGADAGGVVVVPPPGSGTGAGGGITPHSPSIARR